VNDGKTGSNVPRSRNRIGCVWSFHENGSIGYRLTERISLLATIEHYSNASLCDEKRGLTNYCGRISFSF